MIEILAPAKINLFLRVCGKNTAGFHLLDSLVAFTEFGDRMTIEPASEDKLILTGDFGNQLKIEEEKNLVLLALDAFRSAGGTFCHLRITLEKRIPISAGLGGGSTDAAALLQTLNEHSDNPLSENQMYQIALKLGADVPVCLKGGCQRVANIGQTMKPHNLPKMAAVLLINPRKRLSTSDVFKRFEDPMSGYAGSLATLGVTALVGLGNDLTKTAVSLVPEIDLILKRLANTNGLITAAMTGSGASCFAFFNNIGNAKKAAKKMQTIGFWAKVSQIY